MYCFFLSIQELQSTIQQQKPNYDFVNKTGKDLVSGAPSPGQAENLQGDLNKMNQGWREVTFLVEERQGQLERALSDVKLWQVSCHNRSNKLKCNILIEATW